MIKTTELKAAKKFGPGYFIREQMTLRDWTQEDLSEVLGITVKHVNKILQDNQPITLAMARILGKVFNTSPEYWVNIDTSYRLWLEQEKTAIESEADIRSIIFERMPINDMRKKGWLKDFSNTKQLEKEVLNFWSWSKLDFSILERNYLPCFTRKSQAYNEFNASYAITWYQMARNVAERFKTKTYNKIRLQKLYETINIFTCKSGGINEFINELYNVGVIFFILPHLQKTYLDGAAFLLDKNPVIVFTARYKRIDYFWFTIAHEIAHVLIHLDDRTPFVLDDLKDGEKDQIENEANQLALEKLKYKEFYSFLQPYFGYITTSKINECSTKFKVHPSIIVGTLAHENKIPYRTLHAYNESPLDYIDKKYLIL